MREYKDEFNNYWLPKISDEFGNIDPDKVAKELFDYSTLFQNTSSIYAFLTSGAIPNSAVTSERFLEVYTQVLDELITLQYEFLAEDLALHILKEPKTDKDIGHNECLKDIINFLKEKQDGYKNSQNETI